MPPETLDFEEPIGVLMKEIEALSMLPRTDARQLEIDSLKRRIESIRGELYEHLTPWQRVLVARHPNRPGLEDYITRLFTGFTEIHGDPPHIMGLFGVWKRAHEARNDSTPATIEIGDIKTYTTVPLLGK